jgi:hypothetical protein
MQNLINAQTIKMIAICRKKCAAPLVAWFMRRRILNSQQDRREQTWKKNAEFLGSKENPW